MMPSGTDFQSDDILPAREEVFQWAEKSSNPSSVVKNLHTSKKKSNDQPLFNGWDGYDGNPITLYHQVFPQFQDDLDKPLDGMSFPAEYLKTIWDLCCESVKFYTLEDLRQTALQSQFSMLLDEPAIVMTAQSSAKCDGMVAGSSAYHLEQAWMVFLEIKNEIGTGSSDPSIQASFAFQKYWCDVCCKPNME